MVHSFNVYIDESGDEGFTFKPPPDKGSSDWFVLTAVIVPASEDKDIIRLAAEIRRSLMLKPKSVLHFAELEHERRVCAIERIAAHHLISTNIIVNKRKIKCPHIFQAAPFCLYYYATRLLLERVSWYCRDYANDRNLKNCLADIVFEHRRRLSYEDLKNYLDVLRGMAQQDAWSRMLLHDIRIHWPAISRTHIHAAQKHQFAGLQVADLLASGIRTALGKTRYGHTEHRFAKTIKPVLYRRKGKYFSYGLKFFPKGPAANDPSSHWIRKHYY